MTLHKLRLLIDWISPAKHATQTNEDLAISSRSNEWPYKNEFKTPIFRPKSRKKLMTEKRHHCYWQVNNSNIDAVSVGFFNTFYSEKKTPIFIQSFGFFSVALSTRLTRLKPRVPLRARVHQNYTKGEHERKRGCRGMKRSSKPWGGACGGFIRHWGSSSLWSEMGQISIFLLNGGRGSLGLKFWSVTL